MVGRRDAAPETAVRLVFKDHGISSAFGQAAAVAGAKRAVLDGTIESDADVLAVVTGNGLKDIKTAMSIADSVTDVQAT